MIEQLLRENTYSSFNLAQKNIAEITAIDYFFAKEVTHALLSNTRGIDCHEHVSPSQVSTIFHVLISLSESLRSGHSCLPLVSMANQRVGFKSDELGLVTHHGFEMPSIESLKQYLTNVAVLSSDLNLVVLHHDALYIRRYFEFEQELTGYLNRKLVEQSLSRDEQITIKTCLNQLFPEQDEHNVDWQKVAVANAINKNFSIIAGGPGTGKTYTVIKLLAALLMLELEADETSHVKSKDGDTQLRIALVAPTGKAAQRLSESIVNAINGFRGQIDDKILNAIPSDAQTIHRLLGVIPNSPNFKHHQDNLLAVDVLLIDEVSMVDLALMTRIFRALPAHTKVIMLGDADQLPSVAVGSVLADIAPRPHSGYSASNLAYLTDVVNDDFTKKNEFKTLFTKRRSQSKNVNNDHVVFLTKSRRFDGEGGIGRLAQEVIAGQSKQSWQLLQLESEQPLSELSLLGDDMEKWLTTLVKQYYQPLFKCNSVEQAFTVLAKFRFLCATRQGEFGVETLNDKIKSVLKNTGFIDNVEVLYHAQPIMISENDYRLGLYNGDIGLMWLNDSGHLMAVFESTDDELKWIMPSRLPQYTSVYAMTIHKTQGSEFDHVAMILPKQSDNRLLSRELLYTGITRAKKYLSISSTTGVWQQGVHAQVKRYSGLKLANNTQ